VPPPVAAIKRRRSLHDEKWIFAYQCRGYKVATKLRVQSNQATQWHAVECGDTSVRWRNSERGSAHRSNATSTAETVPHAVAQIVSMHGMACDGVGAYGFVAAVRSIRTEWVPLRQCKRSHTAFGRLSRNRRGFNVGVGQPMVAPMDDANCAKTMRVPGDAALHGWGPRQMHDLGRHSALCANKASARVVPMGRQPLELAGHRTVMLRGQSAEPMPNRV
jgi:hypothetical protein